MAKEPNMKSSFPSKYGPAPPRTTFDVPSDRLNKKKNAAKIGSKESEGVPKLENFGSFGASESPSTTKSILVELGALHKILDGLRPDDLESTSAWYSSESCCREIVLRFQNLLRDWAADYKKLERCIESDVTLVKCEKCGVVRCSETPRPLGKFVVGKKIVEKAERSKESLIQSSFGMKRKLARNFVVHQNSYRPSEALTCSRGRNAPKINRLLTTAAFSKQVSTEGTDDPLRKIGTRREETLDTLDSSSPISKPVDSRDKFSDIAGGPEKQLTLAETIEYLARGNFNDTQDTSIHKFPEKPTVFGATPLFRVPTLRQKPIFDLHGSRDVDFHRSCNFLSNDCHPLESRASDTSNFSSSSVENLMRQWMEIAHDPVTSNLHLANKDKVEPENLLCNTRDEPPINDTPNLATQIAEAIHKFAERSTDSRDKSHDNPTEFGKGSDRINDAAKLKVLESHTATERGSRDFSQKVSLSEIKIQQNSIVPLSASHFSTKKSSKSMRMDSKSSLTLLSSSRSLNYQIENSERFEREILYDEIPSRAAMSREALATISPSEILPIYRKILESSETMDWQSFERLVTALHPSQRELWSDICNAVSNEAKRVAAETGATTEICIEINPRECAANVGEIFSKDDEITFELDMSLQDVRAIFENPDPPVPLRASPEPEESK